jgi:hypothetical protein
MQLETYVLGKKEVCVRAGVEVLNEGEKVNGR